MELFFNPKTVALIGASSRPERPGHNLFLNLRDCFGENFYPVNPKVEEINGHKCYPSILDVPAEIDVAVIFIPSRAVPEAIKQCAQKGIKRIIIESAGFAEVGEEGKRLQEKCLDIARKYGIRLWGPNCMGAINVPAKKVLSFMSPFLWKGRFKPGNVSLVVQSGMLSAGFLSYILTKTPFGLAKVASIGNKMDVNETEILEYLIQDPDTRVIGMYLESISQGRKFFELAKGTEKPIVVLKAGSSPFGAQAAKSHTASLAQDDALIQGAFKQAGVVRVKGLTELMEVVRAFSIFEAPKKKTARLAILSFSGGAGVVASDQIYELGLELAQLKPQTLAQIKNVFPEWMEPSNPVDIYPAMERSGPKETLRVALEAVIKDPGVDGVFVHIFAPPVNIPIFDYEHIAQMVKETSKPVVAWIMGHGEVAEQIRKQLEKNKIVVVEEIMRGVRILSALIARQ